MLTKTNPFCATVYMSNNTLQTARPIKYWNGKITKNWNRQLPVRMTAEQIDFMAQTWPEFSSKKQELAGRTIDGKSYEPWIYSHGAVLWLATVGP